MRALYLRPERNNCDKESTSSRGDGCSCRCLLHFEAVTETIGADVIDTSEEVLESHGQDWTRVYTPSAVRVAFPRSTQEVSAAADLL